jgi:hypothetical protein
MQSELGEGLGHLRVAAAHAASGVSEQVGPRLRAARRAMRERRATRARRAAGRLGATSAALVPLLTMARPGRSPVRRAAAKARAKSKATRKALVSRMKESGMSRGRKRATLVAGLLAVGAVATAAGALVARRRHRSHWEEYESHGTAAETRDEARSIVDKVASKAHAAGDRISDKTSEWRGSARDAVHDWSNSTKDSAGTPKRTGDGAEKLPDKAATIAKNSRN